MILFTLEWLVLVLMDLGATLLNHRTTSDGDSNRHSDASDFQRCTWVGTAVRAARWASRRARDVRAALVGALLTTETLCRHIRLHHGVAAATRLLLSIRPTVNGTLACGIGHFLIFRFTPTWALLLWVRTAVTVIGWQRAAVRVVRRIPTWPRRVLQSAPLVLNAIMLAAVITFTNGWTMRRAPTRVAPLPRARPQGTAAATARASILGDGASPVALVPRSTPVRPRQVGFALRSSSLRAPKLKARDIAERSPWRSSRSVTRWLQVVIDSPTAIGFLNPYRNDSQI